MIRNLLASEKENSGKLKVGLGISVSKPVFKHNLKRWYQICPQGTKKVLKTKCRSIFFCKTSSGVPNLYREADGKKSYIHSQNNPKDEATEWFSKLALQNVRVLFVYGLGLGYSYDAAKKWLREDENRQLVFFEDNVGVMYRFMETGKASEVLNDRQVAIYLVDDNDPELPTIDAWVRMYAAFPIFEVAAIPSYMAGLAEYKAKISFFITMNRHSYNEFSGSGVTISRNFFSNYLLLSESYLAGSLFGKFKNIPAIICGAGPSLDSNIEVLRTLYDRALIFAGGTAMNALNAKGVIPHLGVGIDPNPAQFTRLIMNHAFETPFLYRNRMNHEALEIIQGDKLFVTGSVGYGIGKWMEESLELKSEDISEGFNVLNFSLSLAHAMGCNPIICVGIDLAYSKGNSYASGILPHPIHSREEHFKTKGTEENLLCKIDINGSPVFTLWKWIAESSWYSNFAKANPEIILINATEGGIGFSSVPNCSLEEVKSTYLSKQYDIETRLRGEIQISAMPSHITYERLKELLDALSSSLEKNAEQCKAITALIVQLCSKQKYGKGASKAIESQLQEEESKFKEELGYTAMLEAFDKAYKIQSELDLKRLAWEKEIADPFTVERKKYILKMKRYDALKQTALTNSFLIRAILNEKTFIKNLVKEWSHEAEQTYIKMLREDHPLPSISKGELYAFDRKKHLLTLIDPEMGLNFSEKFAPQGDAIETILYESGKIKWEQFYQAGLLHGPSTFFADDGQLIAQAWFWKGKKEGKMRSYYSSGHLHSMQRFKNGKAHGLQQFFYKNGLPKSIFTLKEGVLDGTVSLYHSQGQLGRQLHFTEGKRYGLEQVWDEQGLLRIEAYYAADKPIKEAREWHKNGFLAKELRYDSNSLIESVKEWDFHGNLIVQEKTGDFFDQIAEQMGKFSDSLQDTFNRINELAPLLNTRPTQEGSMPEDLSHISPEISESLSHLHKEMEQFQKLSHEIEKKTSSSEQNSQEALWKSQEMQQAMQNQLARMTNEIQKNFKEMEGEFKNLLEKIVKKEAQE